MSHPERAGWLESRDDDGDCGGQQQGEDKEIMGDDKLRDSLKDLFSGLSLPEPEGDLEASPPPHGPGEESPSELNGELPSLAASPVPPLFPSIISPEGGEEHVSGEKGEGKEAEKIVASTEDLSAWRQQLMRGVLRVLIIIGAPAVVLASYSAYVQKHIWPIPFYVGAFALVVLIALWRRAPYTLQAWTVLGLVYGLGVLDLADLWLVGDGRLLLLTLPFLAVLFFGRREGLFTLVLGALTLVVFGWAFSTDVLVFLPTERQELLEPSFWLSGVVIFLMLGTLVVIAQNYLVPRLAASLDQSRSLAREMEAHGARLEKQISERTQALQEANYALQRRAIQLEASAEVGRAITSIFDVDQLLRQTVDLIRDRFDFYHAGIFLVDETGEWAVLQEATGEAGAQMKAQGHRLAVGETSMVGWTALHRQPRVALYAGEDAVRFANPLLPYTRSEMTLPLMVGGRLLGVLNVQSTEEAAFDEDDVRVLQSMADQITVALENARRVSDEAALLETTSPIYRASRRLTTAKATSEVADAIIASVAETGADGCLVVEFEFSPTGEPEALLYRGVWRRDREPEFQPGMRLPIVASPFPIEMVSSLWTVVDVEQDKRLPQSARQVFMETGARALVNIPLHAREKVIGQVVVLRATSGPFSNAALRLYEVLSDQAAVALERAQLLEEVQERVEQEQMTRQMIDHIRRAVDIEQALQTTAEELSQAMRVPRVSIELGLEERVEA
jgi:GAF domain-containing protein